MTLSYGFSFLPLINLPFFSGLADIGLKEKMAEEHEVAEVHERGPDDVLHVGMALAMVHPGEDQVIDHATHQHLGDLRQGDEHGELARDPEASGPQGIVRVHDGVHSIVHGHEPAAPGHHVLVGIPRVQQHGNVMVPVQEDELLLPKNNEYCIT